MEREVSSSLHAKRGIVSSVMSFHLPHRSPPPCYPRSLWSLHSSLGLCGCLIPAEPVMAGKKCSPVSIERNQSSHLASLNEPTFSCYPQLSWTFQHLCSPFRGTRNIPELLVLNPSSALKNSLGLPPAAFPGRQRVILLKRRPPISASPHLSLPSWSVTATVLLLEPWWMEEPVRDFTRYWSDNGWWKWAFGDLKCLNKLFLYSTLLGPI